MNDPVNDPCINGPKLAAWLKERDRLPVSLVGARRRGNSGDPVENLWRRVNRWSEGEQASLETADKWLTLIGCHLSELPDDFWEDARPRHKGGYRVYSEFERRRALQLLDDGLSPSEVARGIGCSPKSVALWKKAAA